MTSQCRPHLYAFHQKLTFSRNRSRCLHLEIHTRLFWLRICRGSWYSGKLIINFSGHCERWKHSLGSTIISRVVDVITTLDFIAVLELFTYWESWDALFIIISGYIIITLDFILQCWNCLYIRCTFLLYYLWYVFEFILFHFEFAIWSVVLPLLAYFVNVCYTKTLG